MIQLIKFLNLENVFLIIFDKKSEGTHKSKAEQHISRIPVIEVEGNIARCMVNL